MKSNITPFKYFTKFKCFYSKVKILIKNIVSNIQFFGAILFYIKGFENFIYKTQYIKGFEKIIYKTQNYQIDDQNFLFNFDVSLLKEISFKYVLEVISSLITFDIFNLIKIYLEFNKKIVLAN
jgi:presenilin-like A22 family membrane protease